MATRTLIRIEGTEVCVYKHWDGYPSANYAWLTEFNERFAKERGDDPDYKVAQLLRDSIVNADKFNLDKSEFTGWGVLQSREPIGQEFEYLLKTDGTVEVFKGYDLNQKKLTKAQLTAALKA